MGSTTSGVDVPGAILERPARRTGGDMAVSGDWPRRRRRGGLIREARSFDFSFVDAEALLPGILEQRFRDHGRRTSNEAMQRTRLRRAADLGR